MYLRLAPAPAGLQPVKLGLMFDVCFKGGRAVFVWCEPRMLSWGSVVCGCLAGVLCYFSQLNFNGLLVNSSGYVCNFDCCHFWFKNE